MSSFAPLDCCSFHSILQFHRLEHRPSIIQYNPKNTKATNSSQHAYQALLPPRRRLHGTEHHVTRSRNDPRQTDLRRCKPDNPDIPPSPSTVSSALLTSAVLHQVRHLQVLPRRRPGQREDVPLQRHRYPHRAHRSMLRICRQLQCE